MALYYSHLLNNFIISDACEKLPPSIISGTVRMEVGGGRHPNDLDLCSTHPCSCNKSTAGFKIAQAKKAACLPVTRGLPADDGEPPNELRPSPRSGPHQHPRAAAEGLYWGRVSLGAAEEAPRWDSRPDPHHGGVRSSFLHLFVVAFPWLLFFRPGAGIIRILTWRTFTSVDLIIIIYIYLFVKQNLYCYCWCCRCCYYFSSYTLVWYCFLFLLSSSSFSL